MQTTLLVRKASSSASLRVTSECAQNQNHVVDRSRPIKPIEITKPSVFTKAGTTGTALMLTYLRDPAEIYRRSFATIRREADLKRFNGPDADIAVRIIHACGMIDAAEDLCFDGDVTQASSDAMAAGRSVFVDTEMARKAIIQRFLPEGAEITCTLNHKDTPLLAEKMKTTRTAAAVSLWQPCLAGSIVIIGNAPTALFALLEAIDAGGPKPAAVFAFPVGFVGAAESKRELIANPRGMSFVTLGGRRGGSAMAGAAFNGVLVGARDR